MSTIYSGKLTAWLEFELDEILEPILPPIGKLYEGVNSYEIKTKDPRYNETKEKLVAVAREYAKRQTSDKYENPVSVTGEVHHGFEA